MKSKGNTYPICRLGVWGVQERAIREAVFSRGEQRFNYGKKVKGRDPILDEFHLITKYI